MAVADVRRRGRGISARAALVAALGAVALALCSSPPARAAATGSISGTVTEAGTLEPLSGIVVCARPPAPAVISEEEEEHAEGPVEEHCATSGAAGAYTIEGVPPGSYYVVFNPPVTFAADSGLPTFSQRNYIAQAYEGAYTEAAAKQVAVTAGAATAGIDAALQVGGEISGRVTAAATGAPVAEAFVCAVRSSGEELGDAGCAITSAAGEYEIFGLAGGSYQVSFFAAGFAPQAFNGAAKPSEATLVNVVTGQVATGVNAALLPRTEVPGEGEPVLGGAGGPKAGGPGGAAAGEGPLLALRSRLLAVRHSAAHVVLACRAATRCHGRLRLYTTRRVRRHGRMLSLREPLGGRSFTLAPSTRRTFAIRLDRKGQRLLRGRGRAGVDLEVVLGGADRPEVIAVSLSGGARS